MENLIDSPKLIWEKWFQFAKSDLAFLTILNNIETPKKKISCEFDYSCVYLVFASILLKMATTKLFKFDRFLLRFLRFKLICRLLV